VNLNLYLVFINYLKTHQAHLHLQVKVKNTVLITEQSLALHTKIKSSICKTSRHASS